MPEELPLDTLLVLKTPQVTGGGQVYYTTSYVSLQDFLSAHVLHEDFVENIVNGVLDDNSYILVASDIAGRDLLTPTRNSLVWVLDATDDETVETGGAVYVYRLSNETYNKVAEFESMDVVLDWDNIQNKPTNAVEDIDDAVDKRHEHTNSDELDSIAENGVGELLYNGVYPRSQTWKQSRWVHSDFYNVNFAAPFTFTALTGGSYADLPTVAYTDHIGIASLKKANDANTGAMAATIQPIVSADGLCFRAILSVTTLVTLLIRIGFNSSLNHTDNVDGMYFEIVDHTVSAKTANGSTRTTNATTATLASDTFYVFDIIQTSATAARFVITNYASKAVVLDVTNSSNVPVSNISNHFHSGVIAVGTDTGASDLCYLDYIGHGPAKPNTIDIPFLG